jgi:hypothetical protein
MQRLRRSLGILRENYRDPGFWAEGPSFLWRNVLTAPVRQVGMRRYRKRNGPPLALAESDWDNCILLDACRYDYFAETATFLDEGALEKRTAPGSQTGGFLAATFPPGEAFDDLAYVNCNPRVAKEATGTFHAMEHVWQDRWSEEHDTVLPEDARDAALGAHERYPNKRLFVHMVQPHIPYIGETAADLPSGAAIQTMRPDVDDREAKPYAAVKEGMVDPDTIRKAYRESLELALDAVEDLLDELPGKTVVTADHGELLGETSARRFGEFSHWGHPDRTPVSALLDVPWYEAPFDDRKEVHAGDATAGNRTEVDTDRLQALGYRE